MRARSSPTIKIEAVRVLLPAEREGSEAVVVAVISGETLKMSPSTQTASPLREGATSGGFGSGLRSAFPNPSRQPPECATTAVRVAFFPPLGKGDCREPSMLRVSGGIGSRPTEGIFREAVRESN